MERGGSCCLQRWTDTFASHCCPSAQWGGEWGGLGEWDIGSAVCRVSWAHNGPWMEKCSYLPQKATRVWPLAQLSQVYQLAHLGSRLKSHSPLTPPRCGHHGKL